MIKNIIEKNNSITIDSIHKHKLNEVISKFKDSNDNFDLENFIKYLNDENLKVIREGYSLNFLGKRAAELQSALDSTTVFVPDIEHNSKPENKDSENIYISADNLEALRHLKKSYHNRIKCIYIDPPYNTGNDGFCYTDKFKYDKDELANKLGIDVTEAERILNMESTKSNSHSAWLSFMYARLLIAYDLLSNDGVIFISIDEKEQANLKLLCDYVFDENNYVGTVVNITGVAENGEDVDIQQNVEYVLVYNKNREEGYFNKIDPTTESYRDLNDAPTGLMSRKDMGYTIYYNPSSDDKIIEKDYDTTKIDTDDENIIYHTNEKLIEQGYIPVRPGRRNGVLWRWRWGIETAIKDLDRITISKNTKGVYKAKFLQSGFNPSKNYWSFTGGTNEIKHLFSEKKMFSYPKGKSMIKRIIELTNFEPADIFLDFFSGSGTSASALITCLSEKTLKNVNYIMIQMNENLDLNLEKSQNDVKEIINNQIDVCDQCGYPHTLDYIGIERIKRESKKIKDDTNTDIDYGFKHYTLIDKKDTLDTLEKFDSNFAVLTQDEILNEFSIESRLITFLCDDGFGLNAKYEEIDIVGFKGYLIDGFLYLIDIGFDSSQIASLIEKVDKKEIVLRKIVIFGYAFDTRSLQQLKDNAEKMGLNDNKDIIVKY